MPRTAPSWRKQLEIALPVAKRAGGSSITAAEEKPGEGEPDARARQQRRREELRHVRGRRAQADREQRAAQREQQPARDGRHARPVAVDRPPRQRARTAPPSAAPASRPRPADSVE